MRSLDKSTPPLMAPSGPPPFSRSATVASPPVGPPRAPPCRRAAHPPFDPPAAFDDNSEDDWLIGDTTLLPWRRSAGGPESPWAMEPARRRLGGPPPRAALPAPPTPFIAAEAVFAVR